MSEITGISSKDALGFKCHDILRGDICHGNCALRETLQTGKKIIDKPFELVNSSGCIKNVRISTAVFRDKEGKLLGGLETVRDVSVVEELRKIIYKNYRLNDIVSKNGKMGRIFDTLPKIAHTSSTVLIEGESGTGKELIAREIHLLSERKEHPFIALNCAALPESLLESELFGYCRGAFTDAKNDKKGRIALAEGGSLFLDEIGDISLAFQVKLLRFLQDHRYEMLGGQKQLLADVRIIAATNKSLKEQIAKKLFREDLFYRLNVVKIELPPLRERIEDIPLLVDYFITRFNAIQSRSVKSITHEAITQLMTYNFPGNIRELENAIEYAFIMCERDTIELQHLPISITGSTENKGEFKKSCKLKELEAEYILNLLKEHNNNCIEVAAVLGINPSTLYRKMKKLGIGTPCRKH
jgi:transcriptional regulator with PAS, ATPase and Fis domain